MDILLDYGHEMLLTLSLWTYYVMDIKDYETSKVTDIQV